MIMAKFNVGDKAYIIENTFNVEEVMIKLRVDFTR